MTQEAYIKSLVLEKNLKTYKNSRIQTKYKGVSLRQDLKHRAAGLHNAQRQAGRELMEMDQ